MSRRFADFDILLAPCTPFAAPRFSDATIMVSDHALEPATHLGMLTQPISFAGLPVITAPVLHEGRMPLGVQMVSRSTSGEVKWYACGTLRGRKTEPPSPTS